MFEWRNYTKYIAPALVVAAVCAGFLYYSKSRAAEIGKDVVVESSTASAPKDTPVKKLIFVDISGAVNRPGLYQLEDGSRVADLLKASEGLSKSVHTSYVTQKLNLSTKLKDGEKIYIPFVFDENASSIVESLAAKCFVEQTDSSDNEEDPVAGTLDVNSATRKQLIDLPGIGETTADKIISGRPYATIDDFYTYIKFSTKVKEQLVDTLVVE